MQSSLKMQQAPLDKSSTPELSNGRILIVDDVADNRDILVRRFSRRSFETVEAASGLEALALIESDNFDVVLLDVMMPGLSGFETLERIRQNHPASFLPVIMVTAKSQSEDIVDALGLGANDYVTKPIDFPVVLARVTGQVQRRRAEVSLRATNEALRDANQGLECSVTEHNSRLLEANTHLREEISRRLESEQKNAFLAYHDALTGLANRHVCDERLRGLVSESRKTGMGLAVLFIDLDGFKNVNDALGHAIGDSLIKDVAARLHDVIPNGDFIARLGGDEFGILHLSANPAETSAKLAESLIASISGGHMVEGQQVFVGASIGIALADESIEDPGVLLKRADLAMYRAKSDGRGIYRFFSPEMDENAQTRRLLELDLRAAITRGDFRLHYQPIINLSENRISGFEALLRWPHAKRGSVPPDEFITLAEETGLIIPIGEWAIRQACNEAVKWPGDLRVAVNVSPIQFKNKNLLSTIINALASSGLPPQRLELEVTESVLLHNSAENLAILNELRGFGVRLSMDDFGTGYSSLAYFRSFQFDKVKIDRSFVSGDAALGDSRAIVRAVVGLGESFGVSTTAEGVETEEQLAYLRKEGCTEVQGFLFSPAQPAENVTAMIDKFNATRAG